MQETGNAVMLYVALFQVFCTPNPELLTIDLKALNIESISSFDNAKKNRNSQ